MELRGKQIEIHFKKADLKIENHIQTELFRSSLFASNQQNPI